MNLLKGLLLLLVLLPFITRAQDSVFAEIRQRQLVVACPIQTTDSAAVNGSEWGYIPLTRQYLTDSAGGGTSVYFRCTGEEVLRPFLERLGLPTLLSGVCEPGRVVRIGYWQLPDRVADSGIGPGSVEQDVSDSVLTPARTAAQLFEDGQTDGVVFRKETGPIAFFESAAPPETYYVLHPTAGRGAIVRLSNPANGRVIYGKVLGPLPRSKGYANAIAAVSQNARQALGSLGDARLRCEVTYPSGER